MRTIIACVLLATWVAASAAVQGAPRARWSTETVAQCDPGPTAKLGESADNSSPEALYKQGAAYYFGESVDKNFAKAAEYYRKAAEQGYAQAQCELGVMYEKGEGVPQSYAEALGWYRTAADKGYPQAQVNLGIVRERARRR